MATEPTTPPSGTAPPTAPSIGDSPTTFLTRADAFVAWIATFYAYLVSLSSWANTTATQVFNNAGEAAGSASTATTQAGVATTKAGEAADSAAQVELMEASVAEATGLDVSAFNIGDLLQVVDDGAGGKELAMSAQRLENKATWSGATPSLNIAAAQLHKGTLTANATFTFDVSGFGALANNVAFFILEVTQDASTQYTITPPAGTEWDGGIAPDAIELSAKAAYAFYSEDGGSTWVGTQIGAAFS